MLRLQVNAPPGTKVGYSVQRWSDGADLDPAANAFAVAPARPLTSLNVPIARPSVPEDPRAPGWFSLSIPDAVTRSWPDDVYLVRFHDGAGVVFYSYYAGIQAGDDTPAPFRKAPVVVPVVETPTLADPGFEVPAVGAAKDGYLYNAPGSPWAFQGSCGVCLADSPFTRGNPAPPEGMQVAYLKAGTISQGVTFPAAGTFSVQFRAARRAAVVTPCPVQVFVDDRPVGTVSPADPAFAEFKSDPFPASAGLHVIRFQGASPDGTNATALIDDVRVLRAY